MDSKAWHDASNKIKSTSNDKAAIVQACGICDLDGTVDDLEIEISGIVDCGTRPAVDCTKLNGNTYVLPGISSSQWQYIAGAGEDKVNLYIYCNSGETQIQLAVGLYSTNCLIVAPAMADCDSYDYPLPHIYHNCQTVCVATREGKEGTVLIGVA